MGPGYAYERNGRPYSVEEVLQHVYPDRPWDTWRWHEFDGDRIDMRSRRYRLFKLKGTVCVTCGLKGAYFVKERSRSAAGQMAERFHFNLYGLNQNGVETIMTLDHIVSRHNGGRDILENSQPMCGPCNWRKDNGAPELSPQEVR